MVQVFKLIRTDKDDATKIFLPMGLNLIGRGKLLNCDDKRVSRNHGELHVSVEGLILKAISMNPCFYKNKQMEGVQLLQQYSKISLQHGDTFGLLPDSFWFEVVQCEGPLIIKTEKEDNCKDDLETELFDETRNDKEENHVKPAQAECVNDADVNDVSVERAESSSLIPTEAQSLTNEDTSMNDVSNKPVTEKSPTDQNTSAPLNDTAHSNNESITSGNEADTSNNGVINERENAPNSSEEQVCDNPSSSEPQLNQNEVIPRSPKRAHEDEEPEVEEKKIKLEPEDVKPVISPDVEPSTSNQLPVAANNQNVSPQKPTNVAPRERCIYGVNCYRKNPLHRTEFSHPGDADWGPGERGQCPWGRACRRRDPRHWQHHEHPPGAEPPGVRPGRKRSPRAKKADTRTNKRRARNTRSCSDEDEDIVYDSSLDDKEALIVTGKRTRKPLHVAKDWSESEQEADPFGTDESDEWQPSGAASSQAQSQDPDDD